MGRYTLAFTLSMLTVILMGLTVLRSVSQSLFPQQLLFFLVGAIAFLLVSRIDYQIYPAMSILLYLTSLALLIAPFIVGTISRGSLRWIQLGPVFIQPSELIRPLIILSAASFVTRFPRPLPLRAIALGSVLLLPLLSLVLIQPDLGSALVIAIGVAGVFLSAGVRLRHIFLASLLLFISLPAIYYNLHDYQKSRIQTFIDPYQDPQGKGYNSIQSVIAVGSGGLMGRGLGRGTQSHLRFLPENHTDFIFASLVEELGLIGATILLSAFLALFLVMFRVAIQAPNRLGVTIVFGIFSMLSFQTLINISMNIGLAPITGVTLPLVSYGGSSILSTMVLLATVANISQASHQDPDSLVIK